MFAKNGANLVGINAPKLAFGAFSFFFVYCEYAVMNTLTVTLVIACVLGASSASISTEFLPSFATEHIIKGENAPFGSAPYIVSLKSSENKSHSCGGTIIAKEWVITAAHCISKPIGMAVVAGLNKRTEATEFTQQRIVDFGRVHEKYTKGVGPYDIALLHLSQPFEFNRYVQPASLPSLEQIPTGNSTLYGWGQSNAFLLVLPKTLQMVQAHVMDWDDCKAAIAENAPLDKTNICTDYFDNGISACNGDSGGPLVQEIEGAPSELIGIVSWGYLPCGVANKPSIYTRVSAYIDWIAKIQNAYYTLF